MATKTFVEGQEVIYSNSILVRDEVTAEVSLVIRNWPFRMLMTFHPEAPGEQGITPEVGPNYLHLHFNKWVNSLPTALTQPFGAATLNDGTVVFVDFYHSRVAPLNSLAV